MKKISLFVLFFCFSILGIAQADKSLDFWGSGFGIQYADFGKINELLQENGFQDVRNFAPSFSFMFGSKNGKLVNFFDGSFSGNRNSQNNLSTLTTVGSMKTLMGYDLLNKESLSVYPMFSFGWSGASIRIVQQSTSNTLNNYLAIAPNEKNLEYQGSVNLGAAIGGHYRFNNGFTLGILTGYSYPLGQGRWRVDRQRLEDRLRINPEGFYLKLLIGSFR